MIQRSILTATLLALGATMLLACNLLSPSKPSVVIASPPSGSSFREGEAVAVQSTATDAAGVTRVELSVDGTAVRIDPSPMPPGQPSFTLIQTWQAKAGTHTLSVRAYNAAGVASDPVSISITVAPASQVPTPIATLAARPSPSAPAPTASACTDHSTFVTDVTIPDGTPINPGQSFNKTWRVKNSGTCAWGAGYQLVFLSGEALTSATVVAAPSAAPGATVELQVAMVAPTTPGVHAGTWQLRNPSGALFGTKVTVKINVPGASPPSGLAIQNFTADIQNLATGKRLTFTVQTTGATTARIISGTSQRFPITWQVQPNGTFTFDVVEDTFYPNPLMTLIASDDKGNQVTKAVPVVWQCKYAYFFTPVPAGCPEPSVSTAAAEQRFQFGRMVWVNQTSATAGKVIVVLYNDNKGEQYDDTWSEGMPESSSEPQFQAPAGYYQPVRGFGKLWRENSTVRTKIGWGTAPEEGFDTVWQYRKTESLPTIAYVREMDGQVVELMGQGTGTWKHVAP